MKIVYVLVSGKEDLYFEQFYISLLSARKHNPSDKIILLTDTTTKSLIQERGGRGL